MTLRKALLAATLLPLTIAAPIAVQAQSQPQDEADSANFIVPPWPGVTVKTELFSQMLDALGYSSEVQELSSTVGYQTLQTGDSDIFLGGWMPAQQESYDQAVSSGKVVDLGNNVTGAQMGFAVPGYVYDAGIHSAEDLDAHRDQFGGRFYSIESGATVSEFINDAHDNDTYGLGDWQILESSTPGMLSEVNAAFDAERWIVWYGWTPHWMAPAYDMRILDDPEAVYGPDNGASDVRTIVNKAFADANPNLRQLLDQFVLTADEQSAFIDGYSRQERDADEVAREWLQNHPERVATFLEGITTRDGEPGLAAVESSLEE
ncbi:ABC transporter substrate-binding protein [Salinicola avicenniae]|uniref:ABC transporter substrate-binding protein n=1 Tax=Salinicola avicenniae TaxID=2916836 RepID=UPI0020742D9E|nr:MULTISPECIES: ABC transporter substrate-binding protein [unclassified Salinicola]